MLLEKGQGAMDAACLVAVHTTGDDDDGALGMPAASTHRKQGMHPDAAVLDDVETVTTAEGADAINDVAVAAPRHLPGTPAGLVRAGVSGLVKCFRALALHAQCTGTRVVVRALQMTTHDIACDRHRHHVRFHRADRSATVAITRGRVS